jgi:hypothetical protein
MSVSLHQLRLASGRECSTSYPYVLRLNEQLQRTAGRRKHFHVKPLTNSSVGKNAAALYPPSEDGPQGLGLSSEAGVELPSQEGLARERAEQLDEQPSASTPQVGPCSMPLMINGTDGSSETVVYMASPTPHHHSPCHASLAPVPRSPFLGGAAQGPMGAWQGISGKQFTAHIGPDWDVP